jgi:hypothetical protein
MKMSLTRVLNEIKLTEKKITSLGAQNLSLLAIARNGQISNIGCVDNLKKNAEAYKQSLSDLINRRYTLKATLLKANNETIVDFGGLSLSIAEVIDRKNYLSVEASIYTHISRNITTLYTEYNKIQVDVDRIVEGAVSNALSSDGKKDPKLAEEVTKSIRLVNNYTIEDPVKIEEWVKERSEALIEYESNIDFVLSEINAKTEVEI